MGGPYDAEPLIFVSDASAEAERLTTALRVRGYVVVDVPLTLVVSRAAVQRPSLILCDVDADNAIDTMARLRDVPGGSGVDIIFLGEAGGKLDNMPDAVFHEGSGFFVRPVDVYALLRKVEALIGPPQGAAPSMLPSSARGALLPSRIPYGPPTTSGRPGGRISSSPPRMPSSRPSGASQSAPAATGAQTGASPAEPQTDTKNTAQASSDASGTAEARTDTKNAAPSSPMSALAGAGPAAPTEPPPRSSHPPPDNPPESPGPVTYEPTGPRAPSRSSLPPAAERSASDSPSLPPPVPLGFGVDDESAGSPLARQIPQSEMSPELETLLARAEQRLGQNPASSTPPSRLSPDEEVEAVLPAEVLAALDEPLDHDADDEGEESSVFGTRSGSEAGGTGFGMASGTGAANEPRSATSEPRGAFVTSGDVPVPGEAGPSHNATATGPRTVAGGSLFPPSESLAASESEPPASLDSDEVTPPAVPARTSWMPTGPGPGTAVESQKGPASVRQPPSDSPHFRTHHGAPPSQATPAPPSVLEPLQKRRTAPPLGIPGGIPAAVAVTAPPPYGRGAAHLGFPPAPAVPAAVPAAPARVVSAASAVPEIPTALGVGDGVRALARAVRSRYTGALAIEDNNEIRRVVLRDGDLVTAASGTEGESLVAFLAQRGVLTPDVAAQLGRKLAQFGRHAGAALIAHGHLRQDELWPVLRAHAEWIVGRIIELEHGALSLEKDLPGRLQAEPAVFGGATGAEVLVEVVRRSVPPQEAIRRMGGPAARFADGPGASLLGECALVEADIAFVNRAKSSSVAELLESARSGDPAPMLYALVELGVLEVLSPSVSARNEARAPETPETDELDEEALRARIEARMALVREGDYFAVLGINRGATGYDIRRAYLDLRRQFEPNRILRARTADLRDDVDVICEVLDEAYEVLRDQLRRDRYRRALEATPH